MNFVLTRPQVDENNSMDHEMVGLNQRTPSGSTSSSSSANQYHYSQQQQQQEQQQQQQQYSSPTLVWHGSNIIIHGNTSGRRNKPGGMCGSGSCFRPCGGPWCATILVVVTTAILVVTMPTLFSVLEASAASGRSGASASDAIDGIGTGNSNNNGIPLFRPKKVHHETHGHDDGPRGRDPVTIVGGTIEGSNYPYPVAYLHRAAGTTATTATTANDHANDHAHAHVVLLHGAAFTKDTWKTSGILDEFAARTPWLSVTALDLPVSADYRTLARILTNLVGEEGIAVELPLSALVTPSASGRAVTTWIRGETNTNNNNNNADETATTLHLSEITDFFRLWIPVASYSVGKCTADELHGLRDTTTLGVAAVHGTKDGKGKKMSEMLEEHANARVYELEGKHPVYLDQPAAFVKLVGEEVANLQQQ